MNAAFQFTPQATEDLDALWWFIAKDNQDAAETIHT
jgi:plasmid stabilization system protein ParE